METEDSTDVETFYRWVGQGELEDLEACVRLRPNPDGSGYQLGKFVTDTPEHAMQWGRNVFDEYPDGGTVIEVDIEAEYVQMHDACLDGIGPAFFIPKEHLDRAEVAEHEPT